MIDASKSEFAVGMQTGPNAIWQVSLRGRLDAQTVPICWDELEKGLREKIVKRLEVDCSGLQFCDGAGLAMIRYLNMGEMTPDAAVSVRGLNLELEKLFHGFTLKDYNDFRNSVPTD